MRKRNIILAILAIEILTLPAAAHILSDLDFASRDYVVASKIPLPESTSSSFLVNSNSPFVITANNIPGEVRVYVTQSGSMGPVKFGDKAQMPGPTFSCKRSAFAQKTVIYESTKGTELGDGEVVEQAILMTIDHPSSETPAIKFLTKSAAGNLDNGVTCTAH